jgi:hypothetical protein
MFALALQETGSHSNPVGAVILIATIVFIVLSKRKLKTLLMVLLAWGITVGVVFAFTLVLNLNEGVMGHAAASLCSLIGLVVAIGHKRQMDNEAERGILKPEPPKRTDVGVSQSR